MKRATGVVALLLVVVAMGSGASLWWFAHRPGPLSESADHVVRHGSSADIAHGLAASGIIPEGRFSETQFKLFAWLTASEGVLHAAELHFPAKASLADVLFVLRHAAPVSHRLTVPEGLTARQIAALIEQTTLLSGPVPEIREGALLPQTLSFERNAPRVQVVQRLEALMARALEKVWAQRDVSINLKSPEELLVLASIVERETGVAAERPLVARVFLNRLAEGMKLQSDPTAIYDLSKGWGTLDHPLTHDDLHMPGPHNTYVIASLPDSPICSPGLASLEAVAHPAVGDMLYFVADGRGGHRFSRDLREHNQRVGALRLLRMPAARQR